MCNLKEDLIILYYTQSDSDRDEQFPLSVLSPSVISHERTCRGRRVPPPPCQRRKKAECCVASSGGSPRNADGVTGLTRVCVGPNLRTVVFRSEATSACCVLVWHTDLIVIDCLIKGNCVELWSNPREKRASSASDAIKVRLLICNGECVQKAGRLNYSSLSRYPVFPFEPITPKTLALHANCFLFICSASYEVCSLLYLWF